MSLTEILGYFGALFIGIVLGLIGGGGSILTVPILVYLLTINPVTATAYSLFVVGASSLVGAIKNMQKGLVDYKTAFSFAIPAVTVVFLTRRFLVPAIPNVLWTIDDFELTKNIAIMLFFALLMLFSSYSMITSQSLTNAVSQKRPSYKLLVLQAVIIGVVTGLVGAGGGFLIIPALVLLAKIPIKRAVATSLLIIAINSLIGFTGDIINTSVNWSFLLIFTFISILGIFLGMYLSNYIAGKNLKKGFGWFVLLMGSYILFKELFN
ncbi:sulfite exporter TauE/SafE family protein [Winogradskyella vidalii]|uniref:sulfite exporter TauE/SafE family protein n=1 Tax=Winogradskyella vidalii TaxID=2615024 RepID=UPI0015C7EC28|nr:sulfite exporter TauE/SafE family protein [Winogradskyella vidalii]